MRNKRDIANRAAIQPTRDQIKFMESRGAAKKAITLEQHAEAMKGIEARLDADVLDESPAAYKDIGAVMAAQSDLVEIAHRLRQIVNVKGLL